MNKVFATSFLLMAFTGFLAGQIFFKKLETQASGVSPQSEMKVLYESAMNKVQSQSFEGSEIDLKKIKAPVVIVNFWASWCVPCLEEFPSLVSLKEKYSDDQLFVLGINADEEDIEMNIKKIYKKYKLNFPTIPDDQKWTSIYKVDAIPVSVIYVKGKVYTVSKGSYDFLNSELQSVIDKSI